VVQPVLPGSRGPGCHRAGRGDLRGDLRALCHRHGDHVRVRAADGGPHKERAAYAWACEVSVYLELGRRRRGGGRALYKALLGRLTEHGFRTAVAGMTLPNEASVGLHRALGFEPIGTSRRIGWKLGAWHDVAWAQRELGPHGAPPDPG
jgi:phosphinothricin acetyltransferase